MFLSPTIEKKPEIAGAELFLFNFSWLNESALQGITKKFKAIRPKISVLSYSKTVSPFKRVRKHICMSLSQRFELIFSSLHVAHDFTESEQLLLAFLVRHSSQTPAYRIRS